MLKYSSLAVALAVSLAASSASGALTREQQKCQKAVGKQGIIFLKNVVTQNSQLDAHEGVQ